MGSTWRGARGREKQRKKCFKIQANELDIAGNIHVAPYEVKKNDPKSIWKNSERTTKDKSLIF